MRISQLQQRLQDLGCKPCHEDRLLRGWAQLSSYDRKGSAAESFFPLALRNELAAIEAELSGLAKLHGEYPAEGQASPDLSPTLTISAEEGTNVAPSAAKNKDEVARLLVALNDGQMVESVLLPRGGLCVSTQVGCAVGCVFCMSGRAGLVRQLGSAEIVAQVVLARQRRAVSKVVFMGMGEPAHNLDNVLEAIQLLGTQGNIGHKSLVFSTVGDVRVFERLMEGLDSLPPPNRGRTQVGVEALRDEEIYTPILAFPLTGGRNQTTKTASAQVADHFQGEKNQDSKRERIVRPALALSLHSTNQELRAKLLPRAPEMSIEDLVARAEVYARATSYPVQYQWTLLEGINDSDAELEGIARLLKGKYAVMNFIPFNEVDGLDYRRPSSERIASMVETLRGHGILAKVRDSAGQEIEGACGQLRARAVKEKRPKKISFDTSARIPLSGGGLGWGCKRCELKRYPHPNLPPERGKGQGQLAGLISTYARYQNRDSMMPNKRIDELTTERARELRSNMTDAERLLWRALRNKQIDSHRFRRQHPFGQYIADFACIEAKLVIELDGGQHQTQAAYDEQRSAALRAQGWHVLRFWNKEVLENLDGVLFVVAESLETSHPPLA